MRSIIKSFLSFLLYICTTATAFLVPISAQDSNISPARVDQYAYYYVNRGYAITGWSPYATCFGQNEGGRIFNSTNEGFVVTDSPQVSETVSFSLSIAGQAFSISIGIQPGIATPSISGSIFTTDIIGVPVVLQRSFMYKVTRYDVYRYNTSLEESVSMNPKRQSFYAHYGVIARIVSTLTRNPFILKCKIFVYKILVKLQIRC